MHKASVSKELGYARRRVPMSSLATLRQEALFTQTEGICPAPESSHAIKAAIDEADQMQADSEAKVIVFQPSAATDFVGF